VGFPTGMCMDEHHRFELHTVRFLVAQQKAKLARIEKEGAEIDRARKVLTWYAEFLAAANLGLLRWEAVAMDRRPCGPGPAAEAAFRRGRN
jgi:hypothetical protein